jgi:hypothetical protein
MRTAALFTLAACCAAPQATAEEACRIAAYLREDDPRGAALRQGPDNAARVLARLAMWRHASGRRLGHAVAVEAQDGNWMRVSRAWREDAPLRPAWQGRAFVHKNALLVIARPGAALREAPGAGILAEAPQGGEAQLLACRGEDVYVQLGSRLGWLAKGDRCASQIEACR